MGMGGQRHASAALPPGKDPLHIVQEAGWAPRPVWTVWGSNAGGARISAPVQTGPGVHTDSCKIGTGSLPRGTSGRGVALTTHPHLQPRLKKDQSYSFTSSLDFRGLF